MLRPVTSERGEPGGDGQGTSGTGRQSVLGDKANQSAGVGDEGRGV